MGWGGVGWGSTPYNTHSNQQPQSTTKSDDADTLYESQDGIICCDILEFHHILNEKQQVWRNCVMEPFLNSLP